MKAICIIAYLILTATTLLSAPASATDSSSLGRAIHARRGQAKLSHTVQEKNRISPDCTDTVILVTRKPKGVPEYVYDGATNGQLGPQGADAIEIQGVNGIGTVRVNNLANLEALLNILSNGAEIIGVLIGSCMLLRVIKPSAKKGQRRRTVCLAIIIIIVGLSTPGVVNWFVASARDANLFS